MSYKTEKYFLAEKNISNQGVVCKIVSIIATKILTK